jgi:amino acid permease
MKRPWPAHNSESAARFLDPKQTVPAAKFFSVSLGLFYWFAWLTSCPKLITALTRVVKYNPVE